MTQVPKISKFFVVYLITRNTLTRFAGNVSAFLSRQKDWREMLNRLYPDGNLTARVRFYHLLLRWTPL